MCGFIGVQRGNFQRRMKVNVRVGEIKYKIPSVKDEVCGW